MNYKEIIEAFSKQCSTIANELKAQIVDSLGLRGRHDGEKVDNITESYFDSSIFDFGRSKTTEKKDEVVQLKNKIVNTDKLQQKKEETELLVAKNQSQIREKEHEQLQLKKQQELLPVDSLKFYYFNHFLIVAFIAAAFDASGAFPSLRKVYPFQTALYLSIGILLIIAFSHFAYCKWINNAKNQMQRKIRCAITLSIAFIIFFGIATLRTSSITDIVSLDPTVSNTPSNSFELSPIIIALISFAIFWIVFVVSFRFHKTREEHDMHSKLKGIIKKLKVIVQEIASLKQDNINLITIINQEKNLQVEVDKLTNKTLEQLDNICDSAMKSYRHAYTKDRTSVPEFFTTIRFRNYLKEKSILN